MEGRRRFLYLRMSTPAQQPGVGVLYRIVYKASLPMAVWAADIGRILRAIYPAGGRVNITRLERPDSLEGRVVVYAHFIPLENPSPLLFSGENAYKNHGGGSE